MILKMDCYQSLVDIYDPEYLDIEEKIEYMEDLIITEDIISLERLTRHIKYSLRHVIEFCRVLVQIVYVNIENSTTLVELYDSEHIHIPDMIEELEYAIDAQDDAKMSDIVLNMRYSLRNVITFCSKLEEL